MVENVTSVVVGPTTTSSPWTVPGLVSEAETLYFILYCLCFLCGTAGNSLAFHFFLNKKKDVATVTYIFISLVDLLISVLMLPLSLPFVREQRYGLLLEDWQWFCNAWGMLWYCCILMSVFLVAVVSITRCICITFPLARLFLKKNVVVGVVLGYFTVAFCQSTIPYWVGKQYGYYPLIGICIWPSKYTLDHYPTAYKVYDHIWTFELYIMILPILVSSGMTVAVLNRPRSQMSDSNRSVTITILCFTVLYVLCNMPICVYQLIVSLKTSYGLDSINIDWLYRIPYALQLINTLSIGINSALNPCVYIWRTRAFRNHVKSIACCKYNNLLLRGTLDHSLAIMLQYTRKSRLRSQTGHPSPTLTNMATSECTRKTSAFRLIGRAITVQDNLNSVSPTRIVDDSRDSEADVVTQNPSFTMEDEVIDVFNNEAMDSLMTEGREFDCPFKTSIV